MTAVCVKELAHAPEVLRRKAPDAGLPPLNIDGKFFNSAFAPAIGFNLAADVSPHLPVEVYKLGIDHLITAAR